MKKLITFLIIAIITLGCGEFHPPPQYKQEPTISVVTDIMLKYDYTINPYTEELEEHSPVFIYKEGEKMVIEYNTKVLYFDIISTDTVKYSGNVKKIRYLVKDVEDLPKFMKSQYLISFIGKGIVLINDVIYCSKNKAAKVIDLIDLGVISDKNPYVYTLKHMETLQEVAKTFKVSEDALLKWNPHLKYGYTVGSQVRIHWVPNELR